MPALQHTFPERRHDLDWLRVLAFGLLIFYHTGMFFVSWEWEIKNNATSTDFEPFMMFPNQWRMSLLFLISGAAVYFALDKLPGKAFPWERTKRIFFPLVFGMLFVIPPQIYFERLSKGASLEYLDFQLSVFRLQPYPEGNFSWHHLGYLIYIFTYSLLFLPLFLWLRSEKGRCFADRMIRAFRFPALIYAFALVQFANELWLRDGWEISHNLVADWYNHVLSAGFFVAGFVLCTQPRLWQAITNLRKWSLVLGLLTATVLYAFYWIDWHDLAGKELTLYRLLKSFNRWFWMLAILGYAHRHLNFNSAFLRYANPAVYPFYILHQTVIIAIAYYATDWQWNVFAKFMYISLSTFAVCWILYEFVIRRFNPLRFLFGMKPAKKPERQLAVAQKAGLGF